MRLTVLLAAILPLMTAGRIVTNELSRTVVCGGAYGGHLQGVASDGTNLFWSFTVALVKTDGDGNVLATRSVPSHHGDLCCVDDVLYVAVQSGDGGAAPARRSVGGSGAADGGEGPEGGCVRGGRHASVRRGGCDGGRLYVRFGAGNDGVHSMKAKG